MRQEQRAPTGSCHRFWKERSDGPMTGAVHGTKLNRPSTCRRRYRSFPPDTGILSVGCQSKRRAHHFQESEGIDVYHLAVPRRKRLQTRGGSLAF